MSERKRRTCRDDEEMAKTRKWETRKKNGGTWFLVFDVFNYFAISWDGPLIQVLTVVEVFHPGREFSLVPSCAPTVFLINRLQYRVCCSQNIPYSDTRRVNTCAIRCNSRNKFNIITIAQSRVLLCRVDSGVLERIGKNATVATIPLQL